MSPRSLALVSVVVALTAAAPATADQGQSVTATGSAQLKVVPKDRKSNSSIVAAVDAAHQAGIPAAIKDAHGYAVKYAKAAGLTLGAILSVSDASNNNGFAYGPGFYGPFGPNQYCGTVRRPIVKVVDGKRKVVATKKVHRCFVPPFVVTVLTVTYAAT
jgi:opacity protein-like surface antigen